MSPMMLSAWPWWTIAAAGAAAIVCILAAAQTLVLVANRRLHVLARALLDQGLSAGDTAFAVGAKKNRILVSEGRLTTIDADERRVIQHVSLDRLVSLKIYQDASEQIGLRMFLMSGAHSRRVSTPSITDVARLCNLVVDSGRELDYLED